MKPFRFGKLCLQRRGEPRDRFLAKVQQTANCWLWTGSRAGGIMADQYGQFWLDGERMGAHRAAYLLWVGTIPDGLDVLHSCDTKLCVNPAHLRVGTHTENQRDARERHADWTLRGEAHPRARLTWASVDLIRQAAARGVPHAQIAPQHGITPAYVSAIVHERRWRSDITVKSEAVA